MTSPKTFSIKFEPLFCVHRHALFICKFTSPCSMIQCRGKAAPYPPVGGGPAIRRGPQCILY